MHGHSCLIWRWKQRTSPSSPFYLRTELLDGDGALLRRYRYAERRSDRGLSLPGRIEADYYGKGKLRRAERWLLQWRPAGVAPSSEGACLRVSGQPQESSI